MSTPAYLKALIEADKEYGQIDYQLKKAAGIKAAADEQHAHWARKLKERREYLSWQTLTPCPRSVHNKLSGWDDGTEDSAMFRAGMCYCRRCGECVGDGGPFV